MLLNRTDRFFDPEAVWQSLESPNTASTEQLREYRVKQYGVTTLYLGVVAATGERALWLQLPARPSSRPTLNLPDALWVKTIEYPSHVQFAVVLIEPAARAAFTELARDLVSTLGNADTPATDALYALLQRWQPQSTEPTRFAA